MPRAPLRLVFAAVCMSAVGLAAGAGTPAFALREVADGVYVHEGRVDDVAPANHGDIANIGFIVGNACVAVVDSGETFAIGAALRTALRGVTSLPVCFVINTHAHPDHVFGNAAFLPDAPRFVGHVRLPAALAAKGGNYQRALARDLGEDAAASELVAATLLVDRERTLDLGGRALTLRAWAPAHTDCDLTVYDARTDTWWLSDLLFVDHVPVVDGSARGWLAALAELAALPPPAHVVPGHGAIDPPWPQSIDAERRYLDGLVGEVRAALRGGLTMQQAIDTVGVAGRADWRVFDSFHRRNVTAVYAEYEWED